MNEKSLVHHYACTHTNACTTTCMPDPFAHGANVGQGIKTLNICGVSTYFLKRSVAYNLQFNRQVLLVP